MATPLGRFRKGSGGDQPKQSQAQRLARLAEQARTRAQKGDIHRSERAVDNLRVLVEKGLPKVTTLTEMTYINVVMYRPVSSGYSRSRVNAVADDSTFKGTVWDVMDNTGFESWVEPEGNLYAKETYAYPLQRGDTHQPTQQPREQGSNKKHLYSSQAEFLAKWMKDNPTIIVQSRVVDPDYYDTVSIEQYIDYYELDESGRLAREEAEYDTGTRSDRDRF